MIDLLFPERKICFLCNDYGRDIENRLCSICREKLVFLSDARCSICSRKIDESKLADNNILKCRSCIKHPHYFKKLVAPLSYEGEIKRAIYDYKYHDKHYLYKLFSQLMLDSIRANDLEYVDLVLPVPLARARERQRGFNQAELLAREIGKSLNKPCDTKSLVRKRETRVQNKLNRLERRKNIEAAFELRDKSNFIQKKILLVDDIYTTGATIDECARAILEVVDCEIYAACLTVTPR